MFILKRFYSCSGVVTPGFNLSTSEVEAGRQISELSQLGLLREFQDNQSYVETASKSQKLKSKQKVVWCSYSMQEALSLLLSATK